MVAFGRLELEIGKEFRIPTYFVSHLSSFIRI